MHMRLVGNLPDVMAELGFTARKSIRNGHQIVAEDLFASKHLEQGYLHEIRIPLMLHIPTIPR
jgi:hypothetical protein